MKLKLQPLNSKCCGQYCISIISNKPIKEIIELFGHSHSTVTKELIEVLKILNTEIESKSLIRIKKDNLDLFNRGLFILKYHWINRKNTHWVVCENGIIYDPYFGKYKFEEVNLYNAIPTSYLKLIIKG